MKELLEYVETELKGLDRGFVATPEDRSALESFAKANGGSTFLVNGAASTIAYSPAFCL